MNIYCSPDSTAVIALKIHSGSWGWVVQRCNKSGTIQGTMAAARSVHTDPLNAEFGVVEWLLAAVICMGHSFRQRMLLEAGWI